MILLQILIGLIGLGLMVFIHELGHFLAARATGIEVEAFALGWGPTVLRRQGRRTEYRLAAFPIGGYCKMKGEQDMADALQNKTDHMTPSPGSFFAAAPWKRMIVSFAGPFVNLLFAIVVMGLIWWVGFSYTSTDNRIVMLTDYPILQSAAGGSTGLDLESVNSPAAKAGLKTGDRIVRINGTPVVSFRDIQSVIIVAARQTLSLEVEREGRRFTTAVTPLMDPDSGGGKIGIRQWIEPVVESASASAAAAGLRKGDRIVSVAGQPVTQAIDIDAILEAHRDRTTLGVKRGENTVELDFVPEMRKDGHPYLPCTFQGQTFRTPSMNPLEAGARGLRETIDTLVVTFRSLGLLFQGLNPTKAVSGPIRITYYVGEVATQGFSISFGEGLRSFFHFLAFISIALFFGNLLPIPALDGGQILLFAGEAISRKPLNPQFVQRYQIIGAALVFGLLALAVFGDVMFLFGL